MKKIVQVIDNKLAEYLDTIRHLKSDIKGIQYEKASLELSKITPDDINYDAIREHVDSEYYDDITYIEKFKGWMEAFKDEYQVDLALTKFYKIVSLIEENFDKNINALTVILNDNQNEYNKYLNLKNKLLCFSKSTYIEEDEFNIICKMLSDFTDEEAISILTKIGKNNAFIELEKNGKTELIETLNGEIDIDVLEEMFKNRTCEESFEDKYSYEYIVKNMDEALIILDKLVVKDFIKNYVIDTFNRVKEHKQDISKELIEEADIFKDDLESIDDYLTYSLSITLLLVDTIKEKDETKLEEIYNNNPTTCLDDKISHDEKKLIEDYKNLLIPIFNEYYDEDEYNNFVHSHFSMNSEEYNEYVDNEKQQSIKIMEIINKNINNLDKMRLDEIISLYNVLNEEIIIYKEMLSKDDENIDTELDSLDMDDVSNFIVVRNQEKIMNDIDTILSEHPDVISSFFPRALHLLFMMNSNDLYLRKTCKKIMINYKTPNEYSIREERVGSIRICFRAFDTYNDKVCFELISFAYGSCGDMQKFANLIQSVKDYSENIDDYKYIEEEFKNKNISVMSKYITDGLNIYRDLLEREKSKKKGFSLND